MFEPLIEKLPHMGKKRLHRETIARESDGESEKAPAKALGNEGGGVPVRATGVDSGGVQKLRASGGERY